MLEQDNLERQRKREKAQRQEKADKRKKTVHTQIALLTAAVIFIAAGLVFGISRVTGKDRTENVTQMAGALKGEFTDTYGNSDGVNEDEWEEAASLSYETFSEPEDERETLEAGHVWEDLPKVDVLVSVCANDSDWTVYAADNRCLLAPLGSYITGMKATLREQPFGMTGTVQYSANVSGYGWLDWLEDTAEAGSSNTDTTLEAIRMQLSGELADHYDILYCVYQNGVWTDWVKNGETAGEEGLGYRVDGIRASVSRRQPGQESYAGELDPNRPMVALTYDDGPSKTVTTRILDKLESVGGRATFFMVGEQVERNPEVVNRMVELGCEPGNHTFDHTALNKLSQSEIWTEIERTNQDVYNCSGIRPLMVRPPGGNENDTSMATLGAMSMPAIMWSIDTRDWSTRDAAQTIDKVLSNVSDGDIVLMHDLYEATADASMTIIDELMARGYQLVTVSELSTYRGGLKPGENYRHFWVK